MSYIYVNRKTIPEAWEEAVVRCWDEGDEVKTQYDKPEDPPSRDCVAMIVIQDPMAEPRIHKAFPDSLEKLEYYRQEVVEGIHDHWVDPGAGKWGYTYFGRLRKYPYHDEKGELQHQDQIEQVIQQLAEDDFTRRAQAITWIPYLDSYDDHAACLQSMWFRVVNGELRMNVRMRSNDAFLAAPENIWAFISIQEYVANELGKRTGKTIPIGSYCHFSDSFHIYSSYFERFEGFLKSLKDRQFEDRVWRSDSPIVQECFDSAKRLIELEKGMTPQEVNNLWMNL